MDQRELPADLAALVRQVKHPEYGFFGPDSMSWRISRERVLYLGGARALLMQIAHPHVAQGVDEHSNFRTDAIARGIRTFQTVHQVVFGSVDTALTAVLRTRRVHAGVKGKLPQASGPYAAGSRYHANRGDLLLWVWATLVDSALYTYQLFHEPLDWEEQEAYYQESRLFARLFGVPEKAIPKHLGAFRAYVDDMLTDGLAVGSTSQALAEALLRGPSFFRVMAPTNYLLAAATLPPSLREAYGLPWNRPMRVAFDRFRHSVRFVYPHLPSVARELRAYRKGSRRAAGGV